MNDKIQLRRGTLANWLKYDPILADGEMALVATDASKPTVYDSQKVGDGTHKFSELEMLGYKCLQELGDSQQFPMSQKAITDWVNKGYQFRGVATPSTNPGTPNGPVFYLATEPGTYANFGNISLDTGDLILNERGNWVKYATGLATQQQFSKLNIDTYPIKEVELLNSTYSYSDLSKPFNMFGSLSLPPGKYKVKTVSASDEPCTFKIVYEDNTKDNYSTSLNNEVVINASKNVTSYQIYIQKLSKQIDVILSIETVSILKEVDVEVNKKLDSKTLDYIYPIDINTVSGFNIESINNNVIKSKVLSPWGVVIINFDTILKPGRIYFTFSVRALKGELNADNIRINDIKVSFDPILKSIYNKIGTDFYEIEGSVEIENESNGSIALQGYSKESIFEIKDIQLSTVNQFYLDSKFSAYPQPIIKRMALKNDILPNKKLEFIDKYYYSLAFPYSIFLRKEIISDKVLYNGSVLNSSSCTVHKIFLESCRTYLLVKSKHIAGSILYQEYDKNDNLLGIVICDDNSANGAVTFNDKTHYILSNFFWGNELETNLDLVKISLGTIYEDDYYPYKEVIKRGYLPNAGMGAACWGYRNMPKELLDLSIVDNANAGVFYNRCGWYDVQKTEDDDCIDGFNTCILRGAMQKAIDNKTRCRIGVFYTDYPGKIGGHATRDGKEIYYMFPDYVFEKLYNAEEYPLTLIQYSEYSDCYNAIIDWRNTWVQEEYRKLLTKFHNWLNTDSGNGILRKKYVSAIEIRFWGKWGEGHNSEYYTKTTDYVDSKSMIKIVDMYKEVFSDIRLIAPIAYNVKHKEFFEYYLNAQNKVGHFGRFIDHIGALQAVSGNYVGSQTSEDLEYNKRLLETKIYAPMVGEILQNTDNTLNMYMSYLIPNCISMGFSSVRYDNYVGAERGKPNSYNSYAYESFKEMFKEIYNFIGAHIYHLVKYAYITGNTLKLWLLLGNIGNCILYDKNWKLQVVTRLNDEEVDVFDIDFDLSTIMPSKDILVPHSYECVSLKKELTLTSTDENLKVFLRVIDIDGISDNFYLSNVNRTLKGEYEIFYSR